MRTPLSYQPPGASLRFPTVRATEPQASAWRLISSTVILTCASLLVSFILPSPLAAGPKVEIIVAEKAQALEKRAADETAAILKRLYQADVAQLAAPSGSQAAIFIGSPATNPALDFAKADWPKLSDQGHLVKSTKLREQPALIIGGGSPVSTYWAAQEYAHHLGVRSMLYGDLDPISPPAFTLAGFDLRCEPALVARAWHLGGNSPVSTISWGREDQQHLIGQLAKLKFTKIIVQVHLDQPFVPLGDSGSASYRLWDGLPLVVSGDTAGRSAFRGAQFFENPDFAGKKTNEEQLAAGKALLQSIIDTAHASGMSVGVRLEADLAGKDPTQQKLIEAQAAAYERAYPQLDQFYVRSGPMYLPRLRRERDILLDQQLSLRKMLEVGEERLPAGEKNIRVLLSLTGQPAGVLPQASPAAVEGVQQLLSRQQRGYVAAPLSPADLDFVAYYLSRSASGDKLTLTKACDQLLTPICGEEVHTRVTQAMQLIDQAVLNIDMNDPKLSVIGPAIALKHYEAESAAPEWWGKVRESYLNAMNEMYRANTRAREGSRSYTLYLARRYEFGFEFINCLQAVRNAGVAKKAGDKEKQIAELEKAIDSINSACNALAAVARTNSDRGTIAVLNAYVYRPLVKELEKADQE